MLWPVVMETQQYCQCRWFIVGVLVCQPVSLCLLIIRDTQITDILHRRAMTHVHHFSFQSGKNTYMHRMHVQDKTLMQARFKRKVFLNQRDLKRPQAVYLP